MEEKTLYNSDASSTKKNVSDVQFFGDGDTFKLLSKASSVKEGWMESTKVCPTSRGCLVQITTQQRNPDGSYSLAEALTFAEGVRLIEVYEITSKNGEKEIVEMDALKRVVPINFLEGVNNTKFLYRKLI
jgi:hypothetical protein